MSAQSHHEGPQGQAETQADIESRILGRVEEVTYDQTVEAFRISPLPTVISFRPPDDEAPRIFEFFAPVASIRHVIGHDIEIQNRLGARIGRVTAYDAYRFRLPLLGVFTVYREHYEVEDGHLGLAAWTSMYTTRNRRIVGADVSSKPRRRGTWRLAKSDLQPMANNISHAADVLIQLARDTFGAEIET